MGRQPIEPSASGEKKQAASEKKGQAHACPEVGGPLWDANPIQLKRAAESPFSASRASVLGLQRTIGNRATSRLLNNARHRRSAPAAGGANGVVQAKAGGVDAPIAPARANSTGLPDSIKTGLEGLSGCALDDVKVHYNSDAPARIRAKAFTKGTDIHVAPGQEQHVAHEGWHVVQQKQGRVRPTLQLKGESLNDDSALEREADEMGAWAMHFTGAPAGPLEQGGVAAGVIQGKVETSSLSAFIEEQVELQKNKKAYREVIESSEKNAKIESDVEEQGNADVNELLDADEDENDPDDELDSPDLSAFDESFPAHPEKRYTTVGFEHEFGEMKDGPLTGVTHLELAESTLKMPYTGIPFFIETDASNALELVSPPFLIETLPDSPVPDADDVQAVDELFKTALAGIAQQAGTMSGMIHLFETDAGLVFEMPQTLQVERKNITQNTKMNIYNNKVLGMGSDKTQVPRLDVMRIGVGTTTKCGNAQEAFHIQTHVNFAADAETYDDLQEEYHGSDEVFRAAFSGIEGELRDLLLGSALADEAENLKGGMDQVRQGIASVGANIARMTTTIASNVSTARKAPRQAPVWTSGVNRWSETFTSGAERTAQAVGNKFAAINKALEKPHISPLQRDSLVAQLNAVVKEAAAMVREVQNKVGDAFPENLAQSLTAAETEAAVAAGALSQMALTSDGKENLRVFLNTLARTLSGQMAVDAIHAVKKAQEKRYASSLEMNKFKPALMPDQYLSSRVKDVKEVWIKDTIMNVGLGILEPGDWAIVKRVMTDQVIQDAVSEMELPELAFNENGVEMKRQLPTQTFRRGVLRALAQINNYIDENELTESALDPTRFIGPSAQPDFMSHNPKWIGPRQDTYIIAKRVQMPEMWGSKRLHVVELRNDQVRRLRAMKKYRAKQGRGQNQDVEIAPPPAINLESIPEGNEDLIEDEEQVANDNEQLDQRMSGVYPAYDEEEDLAPPVSVTNLINKEEEEEEASTKL
jgi:hypothetical protein